MSISSTRLSRVVTETWFLMNCVLRCRIISSAKLRLAGHQVFLRCQITMAVGVSVRIGAAINHVGKKTTAYRRRDKMRAFPALLCKSEKIVKCAIMHIPIEIIRRTYGLFSWYGDRPHWLKLNYCTLERNYRAWNAWFESALRHLPSNSFFCLSNNLFLRWARMRRRQWKRTF